MAGHILQGKSGLEMLSTNVCRKCNCVIYNISNC